MHGAAAHVEGSRYQRVRRLGEGGFGIVYEAYDTRYPGRIAMKVLRGDQPSAIQRFKREFRSLADILHPNLVRLYELGAAEDRWYFTMELVDGITLLDHVRGMQLADTAAATAPLPAPAPPSRRGDVPPVELDKLRAALVQLAGGVQALHDAGKLHCDLKPENVLVAREGRVVILDFGLVADIDGRAGPFGTPGFVSPEQAEGRALSPASDWYGVGAILHAALTGAVPGGGGVGPVPPEAGELWALCRELLDASPERRPRGPDVLRRLGGRARAADARRAFVGRRGQLDELEDARRAAARGPVLARVTGPSGIGKTMLVRHFLDDLRRREPGTLILTGRCYEQDSVPYKAVDGVIDALGYHVDGLPAEVTRRTAAIHRMFPAFAVRGAPPAAEPAGIDSQALRHRVFRAIRELVTAIAARAPVVCFLDDLQWGDVDSARLLREVLRPPDAPRVLVIAGYRDHAVHDGFLAAFDEDAYGIDDRLIRLAELPAEEAAALAAELLDDELAALAPAVAREAAGSPIFIHQLVERVRAEGALDTSRPVSLGEVIVERVAALDEAARRLVAAIAVAGAPVPEHVAARASGLDLQVGRDATLAIRHARLVATRTIEAAVVLEPAHDRVREVITARLDPGELRDHHRRLAEAFLADERGAEPDTLARLFRGAGDEANTRRFALLAAERAEQALAFDRAAEHYKLVLELTPAAAADRWRLLERHGEALANAGRGGEAAEAFQRASDAIERIAGHEDAALTFARRAAELALRSGRIELGTERIVAVLRRVGASAPRSRRTAGAVGLARRLRLFARGLGAKVRAAESCDASALARLDTLWCASSGLSMFDHVRADALGLQHLLEALAVGERSRLIRGLGFEAAFEAVLGGAFLERRCHRILALMDELAAGSDAAYDRAWAQMSRGITAWFVGDWRTSWSACDAAAAQYRERCRGVAWELAVCDAYRLPALAYLGELGELAAVVPRALAGARERGDLFAANTLRLGQQSLVLLAEDRPGEAVAEVDDAIAPFPTETYLLPHYHHLFAIAQAALYRGEPAAAWQPVERHWRDLGRARLLRVQCLRVEIRHLRARAALALASEPGADREALLRAAVSEAKVIAKDRARPAPAMAAAIRAGIAGLRGEADAAAAALDEAVAGFTVCGMALYAHAARDRRGVLRGGDVGAAERAEVAAWMAAQGVANPAAMVAMLVPGV